MNTVIVFAALTVFCVAQALFWFARRQRVTQEAILLDRLGELDTPDSSVPALLRAQEAEGGFALALSHLLEEAGDAPALGPLFSRMGLSFLAVFAITALVTASVGVAVVFGALSTGFPILMLFRRKRARVDRIEMQLPEALEVMSISLRAGHALSQAVRLTSREIDSPLREELSRVAEEVALGRSLEDALIAFGDRVPEAKTVRTFVVSVLVLRQTGGNLVEVLEQIIDGMRQQSQYARKLRAMTAEGRTSAFMLAALPPVFVGFTFLLNAGYIGHLFTPGLGYGILGVSVVLYIVGVMWTRRLTDPEA